MFEKEYANVNDVGLDEPVGWEKEDFTYITPSDTEEDEQSESGTEPETDESDVEQQKPSSSMLKRPKNKPRPSKREYKIILQEETDYIYEKKNS